MGRPQLGHALACIAAQTHRPLEIVLVDARGEGLDPPGAGDVPVRVVSRGRLARAQAANAGLDAASGEWVLFLDEDDEIAPEHVAQLLAAATGAGLRVAYSQTRLVDGRGRLQRLFGGGPFDRRRLMQSNFMAMHAVLFQRSLAQAGCRFDESLGMFEDWDYWLQLSARTGFAFSGQATATYRFEAGTSGAGAGLNLQAEQALATRNRLMEKWGGGR